MTAMPFLFATCLALVHTQPDDGVPIGLTYTASEGKKFEETGVDDLANYRKAIETNGGRIVVLHPALAPEELAKRQDLIHALLLPGGVDIDPRSYGEAPHEKLGAHDAVFDQFLFDMLKAAENRRLPVLGICLGMQAINVFHRGTLYQDLPSQYAGPVAIQHKSPDRAYTPIHEITIARSSRTYSIFECEQMPVNSHHHQAVKVLAPGFVKTAWSEDGVVEAMERSGEPFYVGVQFHPERMLEKYPASNRLFARFVETARQSRL